MNFPSTNVPSSSGGDPDDPVEAREREFLNAIAEADSDAPMQVHISERDGVCVLALEGELDLYTVDQIRHAVVAALAGEPAGIVFDLTRLGYLDSSGMAILLRTSRQLPGRVALVSTRGRITRLFEVTGLTQQLPIHRTVPDALQAVKAPST